MRIVYHLRDNLDRRTHEQMRHHDALVEAEWNRRVARNPKERARLEREARAALPSLLKRQAS